MSGWQLPSQLSKPHCSLKGGYTSVGVGTKGAGRIWSCNTSPPHSLLPYSPFILHSRNDVAQNSAAVTPHAHHSGKQMLHTLPTHLPPLNPCPQDSHHMPPRQPLFATFHTCRGVKPYPAQSSLAAASSSSTETARRRTPASESVGASAPRTRS